MENTKNVHYKYCIVPLCKNTTVSTPDKLFLNVPRVAELRKKWCKIMKRDTKNVKLSDTTPLFCCEDHFDLEEDLENFCEFKLMGNVRPKLKKNMIPHIFECQQASYSVPTKSKGAIKRKRLSIEEALNEVNTIPIETVTSETSTSTAEKYIYLKSEILTLPLQKAKSDKAIQINIKFRSKAVNTTKTKILLPH